MASAALSASAKLALRLERKLIIDEMRRTTALKPFVAQTTPWWTHIEQQAEQARAAAVDLHALLGVNAGASPSELRIAFLAVAHQSSASTSSSFVAARAAYEHLAAKSLREDGGPSLSALSATLACEAPAGRAAAACVIAAVDRRPAGVIGLTSGSVFGLGSMSSTARRLVSSCCWVGAPCEAVASADQDSSLRALALL